VPAGKDDAMPDDQPKQTQQDPEAPDLEDLARRYVDLWQDQMTALAADPAFAESVQKVMAALGVAASGLPAAWSAWPAALGSVMAAARPDVERGHETHGRKPAAAPGPAPAATAPDGGGADLGVLTERLAALEQRIAALEGGTGGARRRAKGKPERH
jgi:hypothetical protein